MRVTHSLPFWILRSAGEGEGHKHIRHGMNGGKMGPAVSVTGIDNSDTPIGLIQFSITRMCEALDLVRVKHQ